MNARNRKRGAARAMTDRRRVRIRSGGFPDKEIDKLIALYRQTWWASERTAGDVRRMLRNTPITFHAWRGTSLVGFARLLTDFTYRAVLYDVVVDTAHQGVGIGKLLLVAIHTHPKLNTISSWYLATDDKHEFYEKFGWKRHRDKFMEFVAGAPAKSPRKRRRSRS